MALKSSYPPKSNNMKIKTHFQSLIIGVTLGIAAMLTMAAASFSPLSPGRFQLVAADHYLFKIDTSTGRVWQTSSSAPTSDFMAPNLRLPSTPNPESEK